MPSPVAHAMGGVIAAFLVDSFARRPSLTLSLLAAAGAMGVAPDLDILAGSHRTHTHSVGAVAIVGVSLWLVLRRRVSGSAVVAALTAAYASHLPLDWLSKDTAAPSGLTVLWPLTAKYYTSGWDVFGEISRRYRLPEEFIFGNLRAAAWECMLMGPLLFVAWVFWSKRTLKTKIEEGKTNRAA
jgi:hypothetical protein